MTRARARALENEVTSFLSDITYDSLETWLLPKSDMLCMIRYQENPLEDAREDGQAAKSTDEKERRKEKKAAPGPRHPTPAPDIRPLETSTTATIQQPKLQDPDMRPQPRTSGPAPARTSGLCPEIRRPSQNIPEAEPLQPGHPALREGPDIRPVARTSGPVCLRTVKGRGPCTLSPPRLYIPQIGRAHV